MPVVHSRAIEPEVSSRPHKVGDRPVPQIAVVFENYDAWPPAIQRKSLQGLQLVVFDIDGGEVELLHAGSSRRFTLAGTTGARRSYPGTHFGAASEPGEDASRRKLMSNA